MGFTKTKEDFVCENCGFKVKGSGYTNHCPKCLYSKHVDVTPGDRAEKCGGLMSPEGFEQKDGRQIIIQKCEKCGAIKRCRTSPQDSVDELVKLSETLAKKTFF